MQVNSVLNRLCKCIYCAICSLDIPMQGQTDTQQAFPLKIGYLIIFYALQKSASPSVHVSIFNI